MHNVMYEMKTLELYSFWYRLQGYDELKMQYISFKMKNLQGDGHIRLHKCGYMVELNA